MPKIRRRIMDTGNYMQNQMGNLIESGLQQYDKFCKDVDIRIEKFIKERGYTWTHEEIIQQYIEMYSKGYYVSHTCRLVIENFKEDLEKVTGIKSKE